MLAQLLRKHGLGSRVVTHGEVSRERIRSLDVAGVAVAPLRLLVGVDGETRRDSVHLEVEAGTLLVGYTDGLIEHPGADLDEGIAALVERLRAAPVGAGPTDLCAHAIDTELDRRDDVALIAVRFG